MRKVIIQNTKELIGRRVRQEMEKQGISPEVIAKQANIPMDLFTQLIAGQPLWFTRRMMEDLAKALRLIEGRGDVQVEDLTDEELESLFYPAPPEQLEMDFDE